MENKPAVFENGAFDGALFHGISQGQHWNGFACPLFSFEEASRLASINNRTDCCGMLVYDEPKDAFLFYDIDTDNIEPVEYASVLVDGQKYYPIGAFGWCWTDVSEEEVAVLSANTMKELREMRRIGMHVPDKAFTLAADRDTLEDCLGTQVSDVADLLVSLSSC